MASEPLTRVLDVLEWLGCRGLMTKPGERWQYHCPAHDDRKPSLTVTRNRDGTVLIHCHAGCSTEAILSALGLTVKDLFPNVQGVHVREQKKASPTNPSQGNPPTGPSSTNGKVYSTAREALWSYGLGKPTKWWKYEDAERRVVMVMARWDRRDGKEIRPVYRTPSGWKLGALPPPRPLYRLPELLQADSGTPVIVVEGEKCVDAAVGLGFVATTSPNGAQAAKHADWTPLKGRDVWIIPDFDDAGRKYARDVTELAYQAGAEAVKILPLDTLFPQSKETFPRGMDIADVVQGFREDANAAELLEGLAERIRFVAANTPPEPRPGDAPAERPAEPSPTATQSELDGDAFPPALAWQPYPVDALPHPLSDFVKAAAASMCCDTAFLALPLLTACGAAIGLTQVIETKGGSVTENWRVPPILWTAIIGESGSLKTPSMKLALQWLQARQKVWFKDYETRRQEYQVNRLAYEKALAEWKRAKDAGEPPEEPKQPTARRILVSDTTVEAIAPILQANPRGLLLARDELAAWIASFDRYANTQGGDASFWLSCYNATPHTVDRRTRDTIHVPYPAVSVTGGIQPGTLQRAFTLALRENGLLARFLLTWPPRQPRVWNENSIPENIRAGVGYVFDRLLDLDFDYGPDGEPCPKVVNLSPQAKAAYERFYNRHNQELIDLTGDLAAAFSKLEEIPLRLGLILHLVRWAAGESVNPNVIDVESMDRAITLTEWHKNETARIYDILARGAEGNHQEELVQWIANRGGAVTVRDLTHGLRRFRGKRLEAEKALNELVKAGLGHWEEPPADQKGGRPKSVFILRHHVTTSPKPRKSRVSEGFGDGDTGDTSKNGGDHQDTPNLTPPESGGTDSGDSGRPQRPEVDLDELNRRLAEAVEYDADAWVDFS